MPWSRCLLSWLRAVRLKGLGVGQGRLGGFVVAQVKGGSGSIGVAQVKTGLGVSASAECA
jgi:hypothetical protein